MKFNFIHIGINRSSPYPPNFSKIAAKIIDPSKGASTWAFGNHKCVKYIGILIKNAVIKGKIILWVFIKMNENVNEVKLFILMIIISNGSDARIVYRIK